MCRSGNRAQGHPAHYGSSARQARQAEGTDHAGNGQGVMVVAPASSAVMPGVRVIVLAPAALQNFSSSMSAMGVIHDQDGQSDSTAYVRFASERGHTRLVSLCRLSA